MTERATLTANIVPGSVRVFYNGMLVYDNAPGGPKLGNLTKLDELGTVLKFEVYEAEVIRYVLAVAGGSINKAARMLHIARSTFYSKMRKHSIKRESK